MESGITNLLDLTGKVEVVKYLVLQKLSICLYCSKKLPERLLKLSSSVLNTKLLYKYHEIALFQFFTQQYCLLNSAYLLLSVLQAKSKLVATLFSKVTVTEPTSGRTVGMKSLLLLLEASPSHF